MTVSKPLTLVRSEPRLAAESILDALPSPIVAVDAAGRIRFVNAAAQQFLAGGAPALVGRALVDILPADSPLHGLIERARATGRSLSEYAVSIEAPRIGNRLVAIEVAPLPEGLGAVVALHEQQVTRKLDRQSNQRDAARSVAAMAAVLAHEVKNPLSGIRGAAQLLERGATQADRQLTELIRQETDRIVGLLDSMELFTDTRPIERRPVNVHEVLDHVRRVAAAGFAYDHRFVTAYDPSLPAVDGNRDRLVQIFLNLVKNAAEAAPGGTIRLATAYRPGMRLAVPGAGAGTQLPLLVTVEDNGPGVPDALRDRLFDPFVAGKPNGKGLGLAVVAKYVGDHGGIVEFASEPRRTIFSVLLPMAREGGS